METKPVTEPGFKPVDGAKGRVGKVSVGVYMTKEEDRRELIKKLKIMARAIGVEDEFNEISGDSFEDVISEIEKVLARKNNWAKYTIFAEEYPKVDGKIGIKLLLPRFNFCESEDTPESESKLTKFDKNNQYHYKKATKQQEAKSGGGSLDDLPF